MFGAVMGLAGCGKTYTPEKWIFPVGYVGWAQVRYSARNAPALPIVAGRILIEVPQFGFVETSLSGAALAFPSFRMDQFVERTEKMERELRKYDGNMFSEYGVYSSYSRLTGVGGGRLYSCVFVGTLRQMLEEKRTCEEVFNRYLH